MCVSGTSGQLQDVQIVILNVLRLLLCALGKILVTSFDPHEPDPHPFLRLDLKVP